jgi:hypothetical protein
VVKGKILCGAFAVEVESNELTLVHDASGGVEKQALNREAQSVQNRVFCEQRRWCTNTDYQQRVTDQPANPGNLTSDLNHVLYL